MCDWGGGGGMKGVGVMKKGGGGGRRGLQHHIRYVCHLSIKVCYYSYRQPGFMSGKSNTLCWGKGGWGSAAYQVCMPPVIQSVSVVTTHSHTVNH